MLAMVLACASVASAQPEGVDPAADQSEWLARAEDHEDAAEPREALDAWQHVATARPGSRIASRARERISWLSTRSEGDFAPLAALMRFTSLARRARDDAAVSSFEAQIDAMPDGRVRIEARLAVAGDWARLGDTERALAAWERLLDEPGLEESERELVHESMARARMDAGDATGALAELEAANLEDTGLHHIAARAQRAVYLVPIAWSVVVGFAFVVVLAVVRSRAARTVLAAAFSRSRLVLALWIGVVPWSIARAWADESSAALAAAGVAMAAIVVASFVLGEALAGSRWRALAASLAVLASIAAAYLAVVYRGEALPFA